MEVKSYLNHGRSSSLGDGKVRIAILNLPTKENLIKLGICGPCQTLLKTIGATCTGYTNGAPFITIDENIFNNRMLKALEEQRKCKDLGIEKK
jgi:hypothetical protein